METLLGIKGPDFVMLAADTTHANSVIVMKEGKATKQRIQMDSSTPGPVLTFDYLHFFQMRTKSIRLRITC